MEHSHEGARIGRRSFIGLSIGSLVTALTGNDAHSIDRSKPIHMPTGRLIFLAAKGKPIPELF